MVLPKQAQMAVASSDQGSVAEEEDDDGMDGATPAQLQELKKVMNIDTTSAILEGLKQIDPEEKAKKEKEENDRAESEAAKDLMPDYERSDVDQKQEESEDGVSS